MRRPTELEFQIMLALGNGPLHGYGIIQDIEERADRTSNLRSGTLYLAIRRLRSEGLVEAAPAPSGETDVDARRKYFRLTELGRRTAADELQRLRELVRVGGDRALLGPESA